MQPNRKPGDYRDRGGELRDAATARRRGLSVHALARRRQMRLQALRETAIAATVPIGSEPQEIVTLFAATVDRAVRGLGGCGGRLVLAHDTAWRVFLPPGAPPADGVAIKPDGVVAVAIRADGVTEHVLKTAVVAEVADTRSAEAFGPYPQLAASGTRSFAVAPLCSDGRTLGTLTVDFGSPGGLTGQDRHLLDVFASHAAILAERVQARLTQQRRLRQAEQLAGTLAAVGAAPDLETALQALVRGAMTLLDGKHGLARIFDLSSDESRVMVFVEAHADGRLEVCWHPAGHVLPGTFGGQLRDGGPPTLVEDFWELDAARYPAYAAMRRQEMRSSVNVPIDAGGQRIGSLHVDHSQPYFFGPAELATAGALAAQAGAAIERARVESARKEAQRRVESQARELAARDAEAVALKELDRLKDEFIRTISHELRTPLTVVHGYAQQLHARAHDLDPPTVQRFASTLKASSTRLKRLVEDLLQYARIEGGELEVREEVVDIGAFLERIVHDYGDEPGGERVVCHISEGADRLTVCADPEKMRIAVGNLVENALKYAPQGKIVLRAYRYSGSRPDEVGESHEVVRVEVEDRGPGIPVREQARIWERFYRGGAVAGLNVVPGSGIGLAVVKALIEAQRGQVGFTALTRGSLFWLELPALGSTLFQATE